MSQDLRAEVLAALLPHARQQARTGGQSLLAVLAASAGCQPVDIAVRSLDLLGVRYVDLDGAALVPVPGISGTECLARSVFPTVLDGSLCIVVADPWDDAALQWLSGRIGRFPVIAWCDKAQIVRALELGHEHVNTPSEMAATQQAEHGSRGDASMGTHIISIAVIERSASVVVRFVDSAIYDAWKAGASDIHFECSREGVRVKLRLDGVLVLASQLAQPERAEEVISRIKVLAQLDIAERRVPQDGRFRAELGGRDLDFRVSIMPSIFGEDAVVRLLDKTQLRRGDESISLDSLGLDEDARQRIRRLATRPHGMLLVTGPTGSGKTTTLYATLSEIRTEQEKTITIEDPVEYELAGVLQIPVNEKKGLTFSQGLRSILRHDPDRILVGEIRDSETAEIAVQAALTGHLVFTTVHANSVFDVISRFVHMNIDLYSLMSALNGVVAQRLLRRVCPGCTAPLSPTPEMIARLADAAIDPAAVRLAHGRGCELCRQTGYKGRDAIAEVLPFDDALRALILNRADLLEIKCYAQTRGIRPLAQRALDLVAAGRTTFEEVDRVVGYD